MSGGRLQSSMQRLIFGYAPANLVPAAVSLCSISIFTRLLSPQAFGAYNLAFSVTMVAQSVLFFAPNLALARFYARAEGAAGVAGFLKVMYAMLLALGAVAVVAGSAALALLDRSGLQFGIADTAPLIVPLLLLRALVATNQTVNRAAGRMTRYNLVECLHATIGLLAGLALAYLGPRSGGSVFAGLAVAAAVCAAIDVRLLGSLWVPVKIDRALLREMAVFCWPLAMAFVVTCSLQYADRFLVETYSGTAALGIYVVAFSLVDRPITLICLSITSGTFPMAVEAYVRDGPEAGRRQAGRNGAVLIGLALPACVGLMLTSQSIATVLVGPGFRDGVALLIPVMAVTALLRGVGAHYVDHAFHLANRSLRLFAVYAPFAAANIVLSAVLVPRYGMLAAAYGALACQAGAVLAGVVAARTVLPLWLPGREMAKIGVCVVVMALALLVVPLKVGVVGLAGGMAVGLAAYAACAVALDLGGLRGTLRQIVRRLQRRRAVTPPACPS